MPRNMKTPSAILHTLSAVLVSFLFCGNVAAVDVLPITLTTDDGLCDKLEFSFDDWKQHYMFTSRTYHLDKEVKRLRFIVGATTTGDSGGGYPCFALAEFYLYDGNNVQVKLSASNFSTNAQEPTEGPMRNICDNNVGTYFHSLWSYRDETTGEHYIDVSLPRPLKDFSFGYVSRYESVAPAQITIDDAYRLDEDKQREEEERERLANHRDTLLTQVTQTVKGRQWDIDLILQSSDDYIRYTALQMDIVPGTEVFTGDGIDISFELMKDRLPSHELSIGIGDWGTSRAVIYSMTLDSIRGLDGPLVHIRITSCDVIPPGRYVFYAAGIRLTSTTKLERILNAIEIALVSTDPDEPESHDIYLTAPADGEGTASLSADKAKPGERVYLHANPAGGWLFKEWTVAEDDVTISVPTSAHTYFVMPDHDVHVTAVFQTDAVHLPVADPASATYYTPDGRPVRNSLQGIYIRSDRQKVLIK